MDLTLPNLLKGRGRPSDVSEVTYNGLTEDWTDEIIHETNKHDQLTGTYPIQNLKKFQRKWGYFLFFITNSNFLGLKKILHKNTSVIMIVR